MMRRSAIEEVGGYDEELVYEDEYMWLEMAARGEVVDAVVAEAAENPQFQDLLCGVWFDNLSPQVVARLTWACGQKRR